MAVSGGVDSMALLHMLANKPGFELVVGHFNHNIREDSGLDEQLVRKTAKKYNLIYETASANNGELKSEESARNARYAFLARIKNEYKAKAIITAHHQDDKIETALLNVIRGTGRKGLSAISDNKGIIRPLLGVSKNELLNYAKQNNIIWYEDPTNLSLDYTRNRLRLSAMPNLTDRNREKIIRKLDKVAKLNKDIDDKIATISQTISKDGKINRVVFNNLPDAVGKELIAYWLRCQNIQDFDKPTIDRLSSVIKTAKNNTRHPIKRNYSILVGLDYVQFSNTFKKPYSLLV